MMTLDFKNFPQLQSERLILRKISLDDSAEIFALRSNPETMKFIGRPLHKSVEEASNFIRELLRMQQNDEILFWAIALKEIPAILVGNICLWRFQKEHYRAELGYMLNPIFHKQGIMKEAIDAVIKYGFNGLKLHSLEAMINPLNAASARVLEITGFKLEGHLKENYFHNGKFSDTHIFSLLNKPDNKESRE